MEQQMQELLRILISALIISFAVPAIAQTDGKPMATLPQKMKLLAGVENLSTTINYGGMAMTINLLITQGYLNPKGGDVSAAAQKWLQDHP